jgi:ESS family glutamate:Na+ symporter
VPAGEDVEAYGLVKHLVLMMTAMWLGVVGERMGGAAGVTLPAYIGAMLVAAVFRNVDDATGVIGMSQRTIDDLGNVALALFLVMALMTLRLWELGGTGNPAGGDSRDAGRAGRAGVPAGHSPADGSRLRRGRHVRRVLWIHARHDCERDGEHGRVGRALRAGATGLPGRAAGGAFFIDFVNAILITAALNIWQ